MELDDDMKSLLTDLGKALHLALTKDQGIQKVTERIRLNGYDIYLIMEANIALDRRQDEEGRLFFNSPEDQAEVDNIQFNAFDENFLNSLKIQVDGDS